MNSSSTETSSAVAQSRDVDELLRELDAVIFRIGRLMASRHDAHLGVEDLSVPQYMILRALEDSGPMRASVLATCLGVKAPAVSMLLQSLTDRALIERTTDIGDRRVTIVSLTATGKELIALAEAKRHEMMRTFTSGLTTAELRTYISLNNKIADAITGGFD